jgi:hypothetical protein
MEHFIRLVGTAAVHTDVSIEADTREEAFAQAKAQALLGDCSWQYDGVDSDSIEVDTSR